MCEHVCVLCKNSSWSASWSREYRTQWRLTDNNKYILRMSHMWWSIWIRSNAWQRDAECDSAFTVCRLLLTIIIMLSHQMLSHDSSVLDFYRLLVLLTPSGFVCVMGRQGSMSSDKWLPWPLPCRQNHHHVDSPHGWGWPPWGPHRHHFPGTALLLGHPALPEELLWHGLLLNAGAQDEGHPEPKERLWGRCPPRARAHPGGRGCAV